MLRDVRSAVDRLAQRVDGIEGSMSTFAAAAAALIPQGARAVSLWVRRWETYYRVVGLGVNSNPGL